MLHNIYRENVVNCVLKRRLTAVGPFSRNKSRMIYTMLKSSVVNIEPKQLNYREFKNFSFEIFKEDLSEALTECTSSYEIFEVAFKTSLDKFAPKKKKWLRDK